VGGLLGLPIDPWKPGLLGYSIEEVRGVDEKRRRGRTAFSAAAAKILDKNIYLY